MNNRPAVLFLCQRLPFPPNKGEKITSFNLVRHLGQRFNVHVGTFVDTQEDASEIEGLRPYCASLHVEHIVKPWAVGAGRFTLAGRFAHQFRIVPRSWAEDLCAHGN